MYACCIDLLSLDLFILYILCLIKTILEPIVSGILYMGVGQQLMSSQRYAQAGLCFLSRLYDSFLWIRLIHLPISICIALMALGKPYDSSSSCDMSLKDMSQLLPNYKTHTCNSWDVQLQL